MSKPSFNKRPKNRHISFIGSNVKRRLLVIEAGDKITLKLGGITVVADVLEEVEGQHYRVKVTAFENYLKESLAGVALEDIIICEESEIFGCIY